jgi:hypothetical protein
LHGIVFNQRAPAAVCSWHIACAGELSRAHRIVAGKRDHFAARVGAERRKLHRPSKITAYDTYIDHGSPNLQK